MPIDAASNLAGAATPADLDGRIDLDLKMVEVKEAMRDLTSLQTGSNLPSLCSRTFGIGDGACCWQKGKRGEGPSTRWFEEN